MSNEITVALRVVSPDDKIALERTAFTEPALDESATNLEHSVRAERVAAHAARLIGELVDEVLGHFGYANVGWFSQYVEIANILSGHDTGVEGAHVNAVRELRDRAARAVAERDDAHDRLAWASNPANWVIEGDSLRLRHQPGRAFLTSESPALFGGEAAELRTHYLPPEEAAKHMKREGTE